MRRLEGRRAIITGGGSGIGRASALRFAEDVHVFEDWEPPEVRAALGVDDLHAFSDSKLVVNQLHGNSQTRSAHLRELRDEARALLDEFRHHQLSWISRKRNEEADLLAGRALGR